MAKRILIVSYHFYPDKVVGAKRMSELARHLCSEGHEVVVVAAKPGKGQADHSLLLDQPGLRHITIPQPPKLLPFVLKQLKRLRGQQSSNKQSPQSAPTRGEGGLRREIWLARLKRYYFSLEWLVDDKKLWASLVAARLYGFAFAKPFDVVISSGPPMSSHLAVLLAKPVLRSRWIMDLRDPWCDQNQRNEVESGFSRWLSRWLEARVMNATDAATVTTPGYQELLSQHYPKLKEKIHLVLNGYDNGVEPQPVESGHLTLLYAGSLYYNRDPFPLLRSVRELVNRPDVERDKVSVRLVGNCHIWNDISISDWVIDNGLQDCIQIEPWVSAAEIGALLAEANVLISFAQGQPMQIPAKMFDYLAARREVLLVTEPHSDTAWLARQSGSMRIVPPKDEAAMSAVLAALYQDYVATEQSKEHQPPSLEAFSRRAQNSRFLELLQEGVVIEPEVGW